MERMEQLKQETNPRLISKKVDPQGRTELAGNILSIRSEKRLAKTDIQEHETKIGEYSQSKKDTWRTKEGKEQELEKRQEKRIVKLKNFLGLRDKKIAALRIAIELNSSARRKLFDDSQKAENELKSLQKNLSDMSNPGDLLSAYYEKISTEPIDHEQKSELLDPEALSQLSEEEYIALWKRLNPHFVSHVTRQGFRDHNAMVYHSGGMQEFSNGLVDMLGDGKLLRPPIAARGGLRSRDESSIREWLSGYVLEAENEEEAKKKLAGFLHHTIATAPKYPDETAVHFANEIVSDSYYGGERNNEVFIVYPSDVIASQYCYAFNGAQKDFTKPQSEQKWNDVFVWPQTVENPGISIDAGIVFLPNETRVDSETGSKYASKVETVNGEEKRVMMEDEKLISAFINWAESLNDESPVIKALKEYNESKKDMWSRRQDNEKICFDVFRKEIIQLGFSEEAANDIIRSLFGSVNGIYQFEYDGKIGFGDSKKDAAINKLRDASANWKRAENSITAKEYWENFFQKNPQVRPKHVEYYNGDPTAAIYMFQRKHNIGKADTSGIDGVLLGFEENHVPPEVIDRDPRSNPGYEELVSTARRIIKDHYKTK
jgi:hypothetical protein